MGKTTRWFRSLFTPKNKKSSDSPAEVSSPKEKEKKKPGLIRSFNTNDNNNGGTRGSFAEPSYSTPFVESVDANKHAIAVAAATAAVAEAALAAAQAAAEVVRLTSGGSRVATAYVSSCSDRRRELAAVKIQSAFRAYLARRALRALKGLVKLQALVRGHIVRKQSADMLKRMQAMVRIQARACANRAYVSESSHSSSKSSQSHHPGLAHPKIYDHQLRAYNTKLDGSGLKRCGSKSNIKDNVSQGRTHLGSNWFNRWREENSWNSHRDTLLKIGRDDDEKSDKILEIDTWKPHLNPKRSDRAFQTSQHFSAWNHTEPNFTPFDSLSRQTKKSQKPNTVLSSGKFLSLRSLKVPQELDQAAVWTAENSPHMHSASSRPGSSSRRCPFTPARSECSRSLFGDYLSYPNYMANTEASRAKVRSQSAPRQRMQFEKPGPTKRFVRGFWDAETNSERGSSLHANFSSKAYSGSGRFENSNLTSSTSRTTLFERK